MHNFLAGILGLRQQCGSPREPRESARIEGGISVLLRPLISVMGVDPAGKRPTGAILAGTYGTNLVLLDFGVGASSDASLKKLQRKAAVHENGKEVTLGLERNHHPSTHLLHKCADAGNPEQNS